MQEFYNTDIESLVEQIKSFLSAQDEFKDYNFEGAAISELIKLFAFTIQYQNLYLNFTGNELFLETAEIADNVYKIANTLNYIPKRKSSAYINVTLQRNTAVTVVIPKFTTWTMGTLYLTNLDDIIINDDSVYSIRLYEGSIISEIFTSDGSDFQKYELQEREDIDNENISIFVDIPDGSGGWVVSTDEWENINKNNIDTGSKGYYIHYFEKMNIKFDNGNLYQKPEEGERVRIIYLKSSGSSVNGLTGTIELDSNLLNYDKVDITPSGVLANGTDEESLTAIKTRAPQFYTTQNRAITEKDYNVLLKTYSKYDILHSAIAWGGEKEYIDQNSYLQISTPNKDLGHIYISSIKTDYSYLNATEQADLLTFIEKFKIIAIFLKYLHPVFMNIHPTVNIKYRSNLELDLLMVENSINAFLEGQNGFDKSFYLSDLIRFVDNLSDVVYTTITYTTSVTVYNEPHKVIRINNAITPGSISGNVNSLFLSDNGLGTINWDGSPVGIVDYNEGFITLDQDFGVTSYSFSFDLVDQSNITFEKESFLKFDNIIMNTL